MYKLEEESSLEMKAREATASDAEKDVGRVAVLPRAEAVLR
jgi:hypothetical protein